MRTTSYLDLAATLDHVSADCEPVIITRDRGKRSAAPMSLEDWGAYGETWHLLRSPRNAERLLQTTRDLDDGRDRARRFDW